MLSRYQQFLFGLLAGLLVTGLLLVIARRPAGQPITLPPPPTPAPLRVYVTGAVNTPGVYRLPPGSILQDALAAAGGAGPQADLSQVNLARALADGDQVSLPTQAPTPGALPPAPTPALPAAGQKINLNTATLADLDTLPGIGQVMAQRILIYRAAHGAFTNIEELLEVEGLGPATFAKIKGLVTVGP